jgi:putative beta-lysine N-acetyltransferase
MGDVIETFGNSTIQHGNHSNRVYLMSLSPGDLPGILPFLDTQAGSRGYTKVFAKVPAGAEALFTENGYAAEAAVPGLLRGEEDVLFMGKYFCPDRINEEKPALVQDVLEAAREKASAQAGLALEPSLTCRRSRPEEAEAMAGLYREVFATYPFPIHDPGYLEETMESHVHYYGIWEKEKLVALASAETDLAGQNAEMTDFATLPDYRGSGLANCLLTRMEEDVRDLGIKTAYTIARAYSFGMNITFARSGYDFCGTLTNNTNISGGLESMNVWFNRLDGDVTGAMTAGMAQGA